VSREERVDRIWAAGRAGDGVRHRLAVPRWASRRGCSTCRSSSCVSRRTDAAGCCPSPPPAPS
jgi:hypothetical protein